MKKTSLLLIVFLSLISCSSDDNENLPQQPINQSHIVEFTTGNLQTWVSVILTTTIHFEDGTQTIINSDFDYTQNFVSVEIPENTTSFELDFLIEDSSETQMKFYGSVDGVNVHQETINQQSYQYQYSF